MPPYRKAHSELPSRRSRRLSKQTPRNYSDEIWESFELMYPTPESIGLGTLPISTVAPSAQPFHLPPNLPPSSGPARSSHSRRRAEGHISRPPNAFMLFRSDFWAREKQKEEPIERDHRDISRIAAHCWNNLDEKGKAHYQELAEQRKILHRLEHPEYKYAPSVKKEKATRKKLRKADEQEEERCKKLASLLMDGVSSTGIREAMNDVDKKARGVPSRKSARSRPRVSSLSHQRRVPHTRQPIQEYIHESTPNPLQTFTHYHNTSFSSNDGFVPTEEIPHLELALVKKEEESFSVQFDPSIRLPSDDLIGSQFGGAQPAHPPSASASDSCFWYTYDMAGFDDDSALQSPPDDSPCSFVEFTNPFDYLGMPTTYPQEALGEPFLPTYDPSTLAPYEPVAN